MQNTFSLQKTLICLYHRSSSRGRRSIIYFIFSFESSLRQRTQKRILFNIRTICRHIFFRRFFRHSVVRALGGTNKKV